MRLRTLVRSIFHSVVCFWAVIASLYATEVRLFEVWDAATLDVHGEQRFLGGIWQYVPWESLTVLPDFKDVQPESAGAYRTSFEIKDELAQQRVTLHFGAVAFRCSVRVIHEMAEVNTLFLSTVFSRSSSLSRLASLISICPNCFFHR